MRVIFLLSIISVFFLSSTIENKIKGEKKIIFSNNDCIQSITFDKKFFFDEFINRKDSTNYSFKNIVSTSITKICDTNDYVFSSIYQGYILKLKYKNYDKAKNAIESFEKYINPPQMSRFSLVKTGFFCYLKKGSSNIFLTSIIFMHNEEKYDNLKKYYISNCKQYYSCFERYGSLKVLSKNGKLVEEI